MPWLGCPVGQRSAECLPQSGSPSNWREFAIDLPSEELVAHVDRLALSTGKDPVPERKREWGYRWEPGKFGMSGLTPVGSGAMCRGGCWSARFGWR
jgi:hypothetical protein